MGLPGETPCWKYMNAEPSEKHLKEIERILKNFVKRWEDPGEQEGKDLGISAKKEISHIEGLMSFAHKQKNA
jgi:hypothetical protein